MSRTLTLVGPQKKEPPRASLRSEFSYLISRIFGCWHKEMSKPFTHDGQSYRACLGCGARRNFDTKNYRMTGPYYFQTPGEKH